MRLQRGKKNFSLVALIELKIHKELRALGEGNVYVPQSTETIQEGLDYATIQLCQIEDETRQEFVIEFESQEKWTSLGPMTVKAWSFWKERCTMVLNNKFSEP